MKYTVVGIWGRNLMNGKISHYLQVEQKLDVSGEVEKVWINPFSIPKDLDTSKTKVGDIVEIIDERFNNKNEHAMACRCSKCSGHVEAINKMIEKNNTIVIDTGNKTPKEAVKELMEVIGKRKPESKISDELTKDVLDEITDKKIKHNRKIINKR
jgi:DNA-binding FrmR family transcriptional regulator